MQRLRSITSSLSIIFIKYFEKLYKKKNINLVISLDPKELINHY